MSQFEEKQIEREEIFDGAVLHVVKDKILLPDGNTSYREFCLHKGAVAVIPITDNNEAILVRQFRYAHHREFLEIPAGKLDYVGEIPLEAAKRELREETGIRASELEPIDHMLYRRMLNYQYLCVTDCDKDSVTLQEGETVGYKWVSEAEFIAFIHSGEMIPTQRERYDEYFKKLGYV